MSLSMTAQHAPADKQTKSILIMNATALRKRTSNTKQCNWFKDGKLTLVADATKIRLAQGTYDTTIDATGKHVYPGFIAPNSTLGL
jgi:dihydroorotase-like cyclic amidohydrolase